MKRFLLAIAATFGLAMFADPNTAQAHGYYWGPGYYGGYYGGYWGGYRPYYGGYWGGCHPYYGGYGYWGGRGMSVYGGTWGFRYRW